jgi:hypothetical protein
MTGILSAALLVLPSAVFVIVKPVVAPLITAAFAAGLAQSIFLAPILRRSLISQVPCQQRGIRSAQSYTRQPLWDQNLPLSTSAKKQTIADAIQ